MPTQAPVKTPTRAPTREPWPEYDPDRELRPDEVCPTQRTDVGTRTRRVLR